MSEWWKHELYSQFGEDGILAGYFRSKGYARSGKLDDFGDGFYVDIGAHHPYMISNTYFFYQRGWRGINVDPTPGVKEDFDAIRPRDINLQMAVSKSDGKVDFYSYGRSVHNTMKIPEDGGDTLEPLRGGVKLTKITVDSLRLETLLDRFLPNEMEIAFMSVDVEGVDLEVLQSNHWGKYRPELIVVEHHESSIYKILESRIYAYIYHCGYDLYGWAPPSLILRRR